MRVGVGQPHRVGLRADVDEGGGQVGPVAWHRRGRGRETRGLEGRLAVEVVDRHGAGARARTLGGQGALLGLVEVGRHPGVEDDERMSPRRWSPPPLRGPRPCRPAPAGAGPARPGRCRARPAGGRSAPGCPATGRRAATVRRRRRAGRAGRGRGRPVRPWPAAAARAAVEVVAGRAFELHGRAGGAGGERGVAGGGPVGVGVVVEEQVQPGRGAEVEQRRAAPPTGSATRCGRGPGAARCSVRPRWSACCGWRSDPRARRGAAGRNL